MFAVYATHAAPDDPLSALKIGERPEPDVPEGWVRVKVTHGSLNRHDVFTLRGISGHPEGITYPVILGNDAAGTLDDGTPVVIYPMMGSDDWRGDETLDPGWHIPSEFIHGTFAEYAVVPRRNTIPLPENLSPLHASVLGMAWLTAYRALFTKSGLRAGETVLIQGTTGGMATALIQLGRAAGFEVWATSRTEEGQAQARALGAHRSFPCNEALPALFRGAASLTSPVILDLLGLTYLSSPALAVLLEFHQHLSRIAGTVRLAGLSPRIRNVLAITRLDHLFVIHETVNEALSK